MYIWFWIFVLIACAEEGIALSSQEEERLVRRIQAHLTVNDYSSAVKEAQQAIELDSNSLPLYEGYIRSLAKMGDERKMVQTWEVYTQRFPDQALNRELIEDIAWGVLEKAFRSSSIIMREMALLAAFFSQDAKGVAILYQGMQDTNYAVRSLAVKLASQFRDYPLIEEIKRLFKQEKIWSVRQQVLEAIGKMKITSLREDLEALIGSNESLATEKALAITALLELLDSINRTEIERLSSSHRAGLRQLACQAIAYFQSQRDIDQLLRLAQDIHPDVRIEAFQALGQLRPKGQETKVIALARQSVQDNNYQVALSAAWILTLYAPEEGQKAFERFLRDKRREVRILASAALGATGRYGMTLTLDQFRSHSDSFVRLNLALALVGQRQATQEAANDLRQMLITEKGNWSHLELGIFHAISPQPKKKSDDSLFTPEIDNQLLRLELLNLLAILKTPNTQQAIRQYLSERAWQISATAAILLLTEGDESAIEMVQHLLKDHQPRVRLQAALILSLWSREESAIQTLEEGYPKSSDWEMKARILEGIGRIGSIRSIPFLIQVLKEPSQTLRLIAAMALIQCLNH
jgi:HEAT repeat protein